MFNNQQIFHHWSLAKNHNCLALINSPLGTPCTSLATTYDSFCYRSQQLFLNQSPLVMPLNARYINRPDHIRILINSEKHCCCDDRYSDVCWTDGELSRSHTAQLVLMMNLGINLLMILMEYRYVSIVRRLLIYPVLWTAFFLDGGKELNFSSSQYSPFYIICWSQNMTALYGLTSLQRLG